MAAQGRCAASSSRTDGERTAPPDTTATSDPRSHRSGDAVRASARGRPKASPTTTSSVAASRSTRSHRSSATKVDDGTVTTVPPASSVASATHCAVPWMSGEAGTAAHPSAPGPGDEVRRCGRGVDRGVGEGGVGPGAEGGEDDVLVAPLDALRHAGGAAGVEEVAVVAAAAAHLRAGGGRLAQPRLVGGAPAHQGDHVEAVVAEGGHRGPDRLAQVRTVQDDGRLGVAEEVLHLVRGVAVVDVEGDGAELVRAQQGLDVLVAVAQGETHPVAGTHTHRREDVGHAVGPAIQLDEGQAGPAGHHRVALADEVGHRLEEVGDVPAAGHARDGSDAPADRPNPPGAPDGGFGGGAPRLRLPSPT